jgi:hypothetical protein
VEENLAPVERPEHGAPVEEVGTNRIDVQSVERAESLGVPERHPNPAGAGWYESGSDVGADESGRSGDADGHRKRTLVMVAVASVGA